MKKCAHVLVSAVFSSLLLSACGGHASDKSNPPRPNVAPTAFAGTDQSVIGSTTVTLDGTGSSDPDGSVASYAWTQTAGPAVTLASTTTAQTAFTAPTVAATTTLTFSLVVTDFNGAASTPDTVTVTVNPPTPGTLTGAVRFMRIPTSDNGLNYAGQQLQPARGVVVQAVDATTDAVITSGVTSLSGTYVLTVPANQNVRVVAVAQMQRQNPQALPHWNFEVMNATVTTNPYVYDDGVVLDTTNPVTHDIAIASGYDSTGGANGTRTSAPFAVLDTVYKGLQLVLSVDPTADFPDLTLDWSPNNIGGNTYFDAAAETIVLSGDDQEDTDEFDEHVIAHEFGHYIEYHFSRSDSIGGAHGLGDMLDIRVAFGEGFGYAFSAIVLNDPVARDTFVDSLCTNSQCTSEFNVEDNPPEQFAPGTDTACYCSEATVWSLLWDIYDSAADANDNVALGFGPIWNVLVNEQRTTHAFTSLFTFISALKNDYPASANALVTLVNAQNTNGDGIEPYASGEVYVPPPVDSNAALPLYTDISVGGPAVTLRSVDDAGTDNKLGNRRYLKFTLSQARTITITTSSSHVNGDSDFYLYLDGAFYNLGISGTEPETKTITNAPAGDYLLEVYEYENTFEGSGSGDYDITVTVN